MTEDVSAQLDKLRTLYARRRAAGVSAEQRVRLDEERAEIVDDLLQRLHVLNLAERRSWEKYQEDLLARDGFIAQIVNSQHKKWAISGSEIGEAMGVDRTWPYTIGKTYRSRMIEWREAYPEHSAAE